MLAAYLYIDNVVFPFVSVVSRGYSRTSEAHWVGCQQVIGISTIVELAQMSTPYQSMQSFLFHSLSVTVHRRTRRKNIHSMNDSGGC